MYDCLVFGGGYTGRKIHSERTDGSIRLASTRNVDEHGEAIKQSIEMEFTLRTFADPVERKLYLLAINGDEPFPDEVHREIIATGAKPL